jgi:hypothetical protein
MDDRYVRGRAFNLSLLATAYASGPFSQMVAGVGFEPT